MAITAERVEFEAVAPFRELYRHESHCQIIGDSILSRGLADPYLVRLDGRIGGYGGVRNRYDVGQVLEFYALPAARPHLRAMFDAFLDASGAIQIEAQTNISSMLTLLFDYAENIREESILFEDAGQSRLECPSCSIRRSKPADLLPGDPRPEWVLEVDGALVGWGGILLHYNPPYGDIHMEVAESERRRGYGGYLVQELKRICYESGHKPSARCNSENVASRATLERAGMRTCGRKLVGDIRGKRG